MPVVSFDPVAPNVSGVAYVTATVTGTQVAAAGAVLTANFGPLTALPTNARILGWEYVINTAFTVGGGGTVVQLGLFKNGTDGANTALINAGNLMSAAGKYGALDVNNASYPQHAYLTRGGQALDITVTSDVNLSNVVAAGSVTVNVFYAVVA